MNRDVVKKLAQITIKNGKVSGKISDFIMKKLSKSDLKTYLFYFKNYARKNHVYITIASDQDKFAVNNISKFFKNKNISYRINPAIVAGFNIEFEDNEINLDIKNLVDQTVVATKNNL